MITVKGIYKDGKIKLVSNQKYPVNSKIILTSAKKNIVNKTEVISFNDVDDEEYYKGVREFTRTKAHGDITIFHDSEQYSFSLFDYSKGGLSFIADESFSENSLVHAGIMDPHSPDISLMDLELEVKKVMGHGEKLKIGCQFNNSLDEELWHGLFQFIG